MKKEWEIALFKFRMIAPVLNEIHVKNQTEYFSDTAKHEFYVPHWGKKKFSAKTFKKWLYLYRKHGFDGLVSSKRKDKGGSRSISHDLREKISSLTKKFRFRTVKNLYDYLIEQKTVSADLFTYATLNNFVKQHNLFDPQIQKKARRAFEVEHINDLWTTDFMYGPYVIHKRRKVRSYLCAIIDDHSRFITAANFTTAQSNLDFEQTLMEAVFLYGIPRKLYSDNGKVFLDGHLSLISARLGFIMIHSKPYEAQSRGKIERFFRTVRDSFIPNHYIKFNNSPFTLDDLNKGFAEWLLNKYNRKIHSSISMTPQDRYFCDMENVKIRKLQESQVRQAFLHTIYRKVNNDATISFDTVLFELPPKYIGQKIEIRFNPHLPDRLYLFENNKQVIQLKKLDKKQNSKYPIQFSKEDTNV